MCIIVITWRAVQPLPQCINSCRMFPSPLCSFAISPHSYPSSRRPLMCFPRLCWSVAKSCPTLCDPVDYMARQSPVLHYVPEFAQTCVHRVGDAIQPSHPRSSPSHPAFSVPQHQGLFQWVSSSHQVAKVLEPWHQSFQWIFRVDFF